MSDYTFIKSRDVREYLELLQYEVSKNEDKAIPLPFVRGDIVIECNNIDSGSINIHGLERRGPFVWMEDGRGFFISPEGIVYYGEVENLLDIEYYRGNEKSLGRLYKLSQYLKQQIDLAELLEECQKHT